MKFLNNTELKWGGLFTLTMLLWMIFEKLMGWHGPRIDQHAAMTNLFAPLAIGIYVLALLDVKKTEFFGKMSWKDGFISGVKISAMVALLSPLTQLIFHKLISPDYFSNVIEYAIRAEGRDRKALEDYFNLSSYMIQATVGSFLMGITTAALVALFVKSKSTSK